MIVECLVIERVALSKVETRMGLGFMFPHSIQKRVAYMYSLSLIQNEPAFLPNSSLRLLFS